jgi:DNA-binding transcriptional LysR family regulator
MTYEVPMLLTVNNYYGVLQSVLQDLGIGVLPDYLSRDFPQLVRVLPDIQSSEVPVFLAYPSELRQSKRVEAFRDFVKEEIVLYRKETKKQSDS